MILILLVGFMSCKTTGKQLKKAAVPKYLTTQELEINTVDTIFLSGTLEYVFSGKLVIFLAGSGPTDRNCNSGIGSESNAFKMLAAELKSAGISSFRYDKRGIGKSTKVPEVGMTLDDRVVDISALVDYFATDFKEIVLLGHSEGVLVGSMAASSNAEVDAFIAVAGIDDSYDKVLLDQLAKYPRILPEAELHVEEVKAGVPFSEVHMVLKTLFRPSIRPFLESAFLLDPTEELSKVQKPVLIISGECDLQVPTRHATALHASCVGSEMKIIKSMGHVLKGLDADCSNAMDAYTNPELALNEDFVVEVLRFLQNQ